MQRAKEAIQKLIIAVEESTMATEKRAKAMKAINALEYSANIAFSISLYSTLNKQTVTAEKRAFKRELQRVKKLVIEYQPPQRVYKKGGFSPEKANNEWIVNKNGN